jgi:hypothetical protein
MRDVERFARDAVSPDVQPVREAIFGIIVLRGRACAVERAAHLSHLTPDTLNRTAANTALGGNLQNALAGPQLSQDSLFDGGVDLGSAELLTLLYGPLKPGMDSMTPSSLDGECQPSMRGMILN